MLYDLLIVALSALASWFITHRYYQKSLKNQESEYTEERTALIQALQEQNATDSTLLTQQYIDSAVDAWKSQGTPEHYLKSLDISIEEKANIYRAACIRHKKRKPKKNPYVS